MAFNRVEASTQAREYGCLVTRPSADLKNFHTIANFQRLGHASNDRWLADRLMTANGQGDVIVSLGFEGFRYEQMTRHTFHGRENPGVRYAGLPHFQNETCCALILRCIHGQRFESHLNTPLSFFIIALSVRSMESGVIAMLPSSTAWRSVPVLNSTSCFCQPIQ